MSPSLPAVNARQVLAALRRAGFVVDRIVGSHHVLVRPGDARRTVTVPFHGARDLKPGTLPSSRADGGGVSGPAVMAGSSVDPASSGGDFRSCRAPCGPSMQFNGDVVVDRVAHRREVYR